MDLRRKDTGHDMQNVSEGSVYSVTCLDSTGLLKMIVGVSTTCHKNTLEIGVYVFFI
jgi:hypothetical protein